MNRMKLNLTKTWKLVMRGKTPKTPSRTVPAIERKSELKMGVTFHENLCKWDTIQDSISSEFVSTIGTL